LTRNSANAEPETRAREAAECIRSAVAAEHDQLLRSVAVFIARSERRLRWPEVLELAAELLHEAVQEALKHASRFDPSRSATAWVRGIAARLLSSRRRTEIRIRRCVPAAVLGEEAFAAALGQLHTGPTDDAVAERLDLHQALAQLSPEERRTIENRYYLGLDGKDLANALGVATPGAARVRVFRALQTLRTYLVRSAGEEAS